MAIFFNPVPLFQRGLLVFTRREVNKEILATGASALVTAASFKAPPILVNSESSVLKTIGEALTSKFGLPLNHYIGGFMGLFTLKKVDDLCVAVVGKPALAQLKFYYSKALSWVKSLSKPSVTPSTTKLVA